MNLSHRILFLAALFSLPAIGAAGSEILIDNLTPRVDFVTAFGEPGSAFYAQTFIAPSGPLGKLTVEMTPITLNPVHFRLLITEVTTEPRFVPSTIVFESDRQTVPPVPGQYQIVIDLLETSLNAGQKYAFILDGYTDRDGTTSQVGVGVNRHYAGGSWYHQNWSTTITHPRDYLMSLADHWVSRSAEDLTFRLESAVPEPSSAIAVVVVMATAALSRRIRVRGQAAKGVVHVLA